MQAPLAVRITVEVKDAEGAVCYAADHTWSGLSVASEVEFLAALHEAVFQHGRAKVAAGKSKPA